MEPYIVLSLNTKDYTCTVLFKDNIYNLNEEKIYDLEYKEEITKKDLYDDSTYKYNYDKRRIYYSYFEHCYRWYIFSNKVYKEEHWKKKENREKAKNYLIAMTSSEKLILCVDGKIEECLFDDYVKNKELI